MNDPERRVYEEGDLASPYATERDLLQRALKEVPLPPQEVERQWLRFTAEVDRLSARRSPRWGRIVAAVAATGCLALLWYSLSRPVTSVIRTPAGSQEVPPGISKEEVDRCIDKLSSSDTAERDAASAELLSMGPRVLPLLEEAQKAKGKDAPKALQSVIEALKERVAARVNDEIITWKEVDDSLKKIRTENITPELRRSQLRQLAEQKLWLQFARKDKVVATDEEVNDALRKERERFIGHDQYEAYLRVAGTTRAERRELFRTVVVLQKYILHKTQKTELTGEERQRLRREMIRESLIEPADLLKDE